MSKYNLRSQGENQITSYMVVLGKNPNQYSYFKIMQKLYRNTKQETQIYGLNLKLPKNKTERVLKIKICLFIITIILNSQKKTLLIQIFWLVYYFLFDFNRFNHIFVFNLLDCYPIRRDCCSLYLDTYIHTFLSKKKYGMLN